MTELNNKNKSIDGRTQGHTCMVKIILFEQHQLNK